MNDLSPVSRALVVGPEAFPLTHVHRGRCDELVHESLCYRALDGYRPLFLDLHTPRPTPEGALPPLIVWIHGGGWIQGSRRRFPVNLERHWLLERMLLAGFAVARIDYRLAAEAAFPGPVDDVVAAVEHLVRHGAELGISAARPVLWGESAGAHLALLAAEALGRDAASSVTVGAVVDWYGPTDMAELLAQAAPENGLTQPGTSGETSSRNPADHLAAGGWTPQNADPVRLVDAQFPPTLIAHGREDALVPIGHSLRLRERLEELGVPVTFLETDGDHVFVGSSTVVVTIEQSLAFLGATLQHDVGPHMDPELVRNLAAVDTPGDPLGTTDVTEARRRSRDFMGAVQIPDSYPVRDVEDFEIASGEHAMPVRLQRCARATDTLLIYVHGGGFVVGDLDSHQVQSARLGAAAPAHVLQIHYRRAPEHPFPAAYDDTLAAIVWARENMGELGCTRLVLAGDSAGGNLVLSAAVACRDRGIPLAGVVANYPATDLRHEDPEKLPATYLGGDPTLGLDPRVSPIAAQKAGLAPVILGIGGLDFLREDDLAYTRALQEAGVSVDVRIFPTLGHGYFSFAPLSRAADRAAETMCRALNELLWEQD